MQIVELRQTDSTNNWLAAHAGDFSGDCLVYTIAQTAGRGQRGNSWESEPGKNLTASALLHPEGILPQEQFVISEAVALAVADLLFRLGVETMVKWPNDIYAGDRKICGILIEHAIMPGRILRTVAGIGININQTSFLSDAPNPVSVMQLTGVEHEVPEVAAMMSECLESRMAMAQTSPGALHDEFMSRLWRGDGRLYPFSDRNRGEMIMAKIINVARDGVISLETEKGDIRTYAFKEIEFIL